MEGCTGRRDCMCEQCVRDNAEAERLEAEAAIMAWEREQQFWEDQAMEIDEPGEDGLTPDVRRQFLDHERDVIAAERRMNPDRMDGWFDADGNWHDLDPNWSRWGREE